MRRLVLDASALLSGIVAADDSPPGRLLGAAWARSFEAVASPHLLEEVERGLAKPYFRSRVPEARSERILDAYRRLAVVLADPAEPPRILSDPEDDYLVALARASEASAIVTGDLALTRHADLEPPAITPREACSALGLLS